MKRLKICIVGSGIVGQATGKGFASKGFDVTFLDIDKSKVQKLRQAGYKAYRVEQVSNGLFNFDVSIITVPTPTEEAKINLKYIKQASEYLGKQLYTQRKYHLVVVKSTVPPGTTENLVLKTLKKFSHKKAGQDFGICMNPEFLREKSAFDDFMNPKVIVIGEYDERSGNSLLDLYKYFDCPKYIVSVKEAEMEKYVHNLFNAVKITFFNEIRFICSTLGIDADSIFPIVAQSSEGMWNPYYGIKNNGPFNGMCLPKDVQAFLSWARNLGMEMPLLMTTLQVNNSLPEKMPEQTSSYLNKSVSANSDYVP